MPGPRWNYRRHPKTEDDINISPFSLADLGLSEDEIAGMDSLQTDTGSGLPPPQGTPNASGDIPDMNDLPIDLMPFSIDELDLGASDTSNAGSVSYRHRSSHSRLTSAAPASARVELCIAGKRRQREYRRRRRFRPRDAWL